MTRAYMILKRLRVLRNLHVAYDEQFQEGLNIIRGVNGSGKSSIADFIFFVLGGVFDDWKDIPALCTEVIAEVQTRSGTIILRRETASKASPVRIYVGDFEDALDASPENWSQHPMRRTDKNESYSELMFRLIGIPHAPSGENSNITMHQILRLMYSDQQTVAKELFRHESFDSPIIRKAVGDLMCGVRVDESYQLQLSLRTKKDEYETLNKDLTRLYATLPEEHSLQTKEAIIKNLADLQKTESEISEEIRSVDQLVLDESLDEYAKERREASNNLSKIQQEQTRLESEYKKVGYEREELEKFLEYLIELKGKLDKTSSLAEKIGGVEFSYCPNCLTPISTTERDHETCYLCSNPYPESEQEKRYLQVKIDLRNQLNESNQLLEEKTNQDIKLRNRLRETRAKHHSALTDFRTRFDVGGGPRELFLAQRYRALGAIQKEIEFLERLQTTAERIAELTERKAKLNSEISEIEDRLKALQASNAKRILVAQTAISKNAVSILKRDVERQDEFSLAEMVSLQFGKNKISVDGNSNFAESSNVILKNAAILALWFSACQDDEYWHPRFVLFDNVEDKGMEDIRSHNFQNLIADFSATAKLPHQVIFTTSTLSPDLSESSALVGPHYTRERRSLDIQS